MRYEILEREILSHFTQEDWASVVGDGQCPEVKKAQAELNGVLREIDVKLAFIARTNEAMDNPEANLAILSRKLGEAEAAIIALSANKNALESKVDAEKAKCRALHDPETLIAIINSPQGLDMRFRLRSEIAKRVGSVTVTFAGCTGKIVAIVAYVNGVERQTYMILG